MANYELRFFNGSDKTEWITIKQGMDNDLVLVINDEDGANVFGLDKPTAIRLVKELKRQIGLIGRDGYNG